MIKILESFQESINTTLFEGIDDILNPSKTYIIYLSFINYSTSKTDVEIIQYYKSADGKSTRIRTILYSKSEYEEIVSSVIVNNPEFEHQIQERKLFFKKSTNQQDILFIYSIADLIFFITIEKRKNSFIEGTQMNEQIYNKINGLIDTYFSQFTSLFFIPQILTSCINEAEFIENVAIAFSRLFLPLYIQICKHDQLLKTITILNANNQSNYQITVNFDAYSIIFFMPEFMITDEGKSLPVSESIIIQFVKKYKIRSIEIIANNILLLYRTLQIDKTTNEHSILTEAMEYLQHEKQLLYDLNKNFNSIVNIIAQNQKSIEKIIKTYNSHTFIQDFAFYKGTTDWNIYYKKEHIKLKKKNYNGLEYIHKLILYKGQYLRLHDLEGVSQIQNNNNFQEFQFSEGISIRFAEKDILTSNHDEDSLKAHLQRTLKDKPLTEHNLQENIYYYAALLHSVSSLLRIVNKKEYIRLYKLYKEKYQEYEGRIKNDGDELFSRRIISESTSIMKVIDFEQENRRIRQRVQRNISNAINNMSNPSLQEHFIKFIKSEKGGYIYEPDEANNIEWQLTID